MSTIVTLNPNGQKLKFYESLEVSLKDKNLIFRFQLLPELRTDTINRFSTVRALPLQDDRAGLTSDEPAETFYQE